MNYHKLISHFGSQAAVAEALGIRQPSISSWKKSGIPVPRQYQIQVLTKGKLKAEQGGKKSPLGG